MLTNALCATGGRECKLPFLGQLSDRAERQGHRGHARATAAGAQPHDKGGLQLRWHHTALLVAVPRVIVAVADQPVIWRAVHHHSLASRARPVPGSSPARAGLSYPVPVLSLVV